MKKQMKHIVITVVFSFCLIATKVATAQVQEMQQANWIPTHDLSDHLGKPYAVTDKEVMAAHVVLTGRLVAHWLSTRPPVSNSAH